jgi:hypothetical protein
MPTAWPVRQHEAMRRFLRQSGGWVVSVVRLDQRGLRRTATGLLLIAAGLTAWVFELGAVLTGQVEVRNWSSVWVGLDLMEITGLVLTAILLRRRSAYLAPVAAATATLFGLDAWFDVLTAGAGSAWYGSLVEAFFGELPMMIILAAIAVWAPRHCRPAPACAPVGRPGSHLDELDAGELAELLPGGGVVTEVHDLVMRSARRHPAGQAGADS